FFTPPNPSTPQRVHGPREPLPTQTYLLGDCNEAPGPCRRCARGCCMREVRTEGRYDPAGDGSGALCGRYGHRHEDGHDHEDGHHEGEAGGDEEAVSFFLPHAIRARQRVAPFLFLLTSQRASARAVSW